MNTTVLNKLSVEQRISLVEELWDSIAVDQKAISLTQAQKQELNRRLDAYEIDQNPGRPAADVMEAIRKRL